MAQGPGVIIATPTGDVDAAKATLPQTGRRFRDAWRAEGQTAITVDMNAARELAREEIRQARMPLMQALDVRYMRAQERGEDTAEIVARKETLRSAPSDERIEGAGDETALAEATDTIIKEMQP